MRLKYFLIYRDGQFLIDSTVENEESMDEIESRPTFYRWLEDNENLSFIYDEMVKTKEKDRRTIYSPFEASKD